MTVNRLGLRVFDQQHHRYCYESLAFPRRRFERNTPGALGLALKECRCEQHMLHPSAPFTVGTLNCFCIACIASMTRPLSQRLYEHEDGQHAITDPYLPTLCLWRFQDIPAYGTMNRPASDLAGDAFRDTVPRSHQIQLAPSNPSPFFFKKQLCITP